MNEKRLGIIVILPLLSTAGMMVKQSREPSRETRASILSFSSAGTQGTANGSVHRTAGKVPPPNAGYVVGPTPAVPGTTTGASIPSNPLDRAYWELYDPQRSVTLTGKVTRVDWTNPNSYIYLVANNEPWAIEASYIQFLKASVTPPIRVDQTITVMGYLPMKEPRNELPARQSSITASYLKTNHLIRAGEITTAFAQKLSMGRPPTEAEMAERLKCSAFGCDLVPAK